MEELLQSLKVNIIEQLNLVDMTPEQIADDEILFGGGLGLDSIDALEVIVMLERKYGVKINNQEEGKVALRSIRSIAEYIESKKA